MNPLLTRRQMLGVGVLGGFTLSQYLRLHAAASPEKSKRSAIFIFMEGGPSHQDTFDLKPEAPAEVRGEFKPISTNARGVEICEHLPRLARRADTLGLGLEDVRKMVESAFEKIQKKGLAKGGKR